jgi:hypothetical protein
MKESYLETITYTRIGKAQLGESKVYGAKSKEQHYMDHCSVCLSNFTEGISSLSQDKRSRFYRANTVSIGTVLDLGSSKIITVQTADFSFL